MFTKAIVLLSGVVLGTGIVAAETRQSQPAELDRVRSLIRQNLMLTEENSKLREMADRPKSVEEVFAMCMQATISRGVAP